ncbi:MAG: two-component regulator propeller domain-containing protein, partial [Ignavibacteria bacterium]|nr:two-component regulator propeller domain-containing protein [Ignavibacteria bacterium]
DNKNLLWIGTNSLGLFSFSLNDGTVNHVLGKNSRVSNEKDNIVFEIKPDRSNQLWISTAENGVILLDASGKIIRRYNKENKESPLPNNHTRSVLEDGDGNIWIGTFAGLCKLNPATNQIITYTSDEKNPSSLNDPFIISLFLDRHKRIWAGTRMGINIFEPDKNSFRHYTMADGLVNDVVVGLVEDSIGFIWVSTYGGLMVLNDSLKSMSAFFEADGLQNDLFNTGSTLPLSSGELAFGGANGLSIVSPNIINDRSSSPSVVVQVYKQSEKPVSRAVSKQEKGFITLEPGENRVRFEFAALDFRFSRGNIYSYKLEGFDNDWTTTFSRRSVTYTNLAAGDYLFRVRAAGRNGIWSEQTAVVSLKVIPPIWMRWWFTPAIFILLVMSVLGFYRSLLMRKLHYERMRLQIAEDLHDEIGSGLARIAVLSDIVQKKIPEKERGRNESDLPEQAPNRIGVISRELLDSIQDVVWAIDPKNDNATNVFERIQIFATQLA